MFIALPFQAPLYVLIMFNNVSNNEVYLGHGNVLNDEFNRIFNDGCRRGVDQL